MNASRVLMTSDSVGCVWTFAVELARALAAGGVEVDLAVMGAPLSSTQRAQARDGGRLRVFEDEFKPEWREDSWLSVERAGEWLLDLERRLEPDIVHVNGYVHAALPWRAPVVVTGHSCMLSWWEAVHGAPAPESLSRYACEVKTGLRSAKVVAAPTQAMLNALATRYGALSSSRAIPSGRSTMELAQGPKRHQVLAVGPVWDDAKNVGMLDRVAPRLSWPVLIAGEAAHPSGRNARLKHARALGALGPRELRREYAHASIFALPAVYEPFSLPALEAGLSACALVLGDIPSLREIWQDAAWYVPPRDDEAVSDALRRLISIPRLLAEYSRRAWERALEFTPERTCAGYAGAYGQALGQSFELHSELIGTRL